MKPVRTAVLSVAALLVAALGSNPAEAGPGGHGNGHGFDHGGGHGFHHGGGHGFHHGGGGRVVFFAGPVFPARYYYPPSYYYYPPPVYYTPAPPPVYVEQPPPSAYWYYCPDDQGYYPHVQSCPGGWQRVAPQPPPG